MSTMGDINALMKGSHNGEKKTVAVDESGSVNSTITSTDPQVFERIESLLSCLVEEQQATNILLKKIYRS